MQKQKYQLFIEEGIDKETNAFYNNTRKLPIMGSKEFTKTITEKHLQNKNLLPEINEQKLLTSKKTVDFDIILKTIANYYHIDANELLTSKRGDGNKPRTIAIYLTRKISNEKLHLIAQKFFITNYSTISKSYYRLIQKIKNNENLAQEILNLEQMISHQLLYLYTDVKCQDLTP